MLIQERNRLNELIRNLQTMHNELERTTGETKRHLRMEKEAVDKELADLRARITNDAAEVKALTLRKDAELKEVQVKLTRAIEDHQRSREVTVAAEAKNQSLNDRIQLLTEELAKKEVEIRELRTRGSTIAAATLRRLSQIGSGGLATSVTAEDINISVEAEQAEQEIRARERKLELELQAVK